MSMGNALEPMLLAKAEQISDRNFFPQLRREIGIFSATPDGICSDLVVDCKYVSSWKAADWQDGPPLYVWLQVQQQMYVCERARALVVAAIIRNGALVLEHYWVDFDAERWALIQQRATDWWHKHVVAGVPPNEALMPRWVAERLPRNADVAPADDYESQLVIEYAAAKDREKQAKAAVQAKQDELIARLCSRGVTGLQTGNGTRAIWKPQTRESLSARTVKRDYPEVYDKCIETVTYNVMRAHRDKKQQGGQSCER
jgi:predicted phage-related endonuclease